MFQEMLYLAGLFVVIVVVNAIDNHIKRHKSNESELRRLLLNYFRENSSTLSYDGDLEGKYAVVSKNDETGKWHYRFFKYHLECKEELRKLSGNSVVSDWCEFLGTKPIHGEFPHISLERRYGKPKHKYIKEPIYAFKYMTDDEISMADTEYLEEINSKFKDDPDYKRLMLSIVQEEIDFRREVEMEENS